VDCKGNAFQRTTEENSSCQRLGRGERKGDVRIKWLCSTAWKRESVIDNILSESLNVFTSKKLLLHEAIYMLIILFSSLHNVYIYEKIKTSHCPTQNEQLSSIS
jgi:hypothetical protein